MTVSAFVVAVLRLAVILGPAWLAARVVVGVIGSGSRAMQVLMQFVVVAAELVVGAEFLGLVGALHSGSLAALMIVEALVAAGAQRRGIVTVTIPVRSRGPDGPGGVLSPQLWLWVVGAFVAEQWLEATANVLGGGMLAFDSLWYHMPFAARFAQSGSVTAIQLTQADPFVAYYPANSELLHAVGIVAFHNDFPSTLLNLVWFAVAALACWCIGQRWRVERWTLLAGITVLGLPVLSVTQPGQGLNDITGLAFLLAGLGILLATPEGAGRAGVAGLALGLALGTKLTFVVPVAVVLIATVIACPAGRRAVTAAWLLAATTLSGGWWYLRDLTTTGSPIGLRVDLGPLALGGPVSRLGQGSSGSVLSELTHTSLWGSRFEPGLAHALSPAWPVLVTGAIAVTVAALARGDTNTRVLASMAAAAGVTYLVLPASQGSLALANTAFVDTLRYATPALAGGALLVPIMLRKRPRGLRWLGPACAVIALAGELHAHLWTPAGRHFAYLVFAGAILAAVIRPPAALRMVPRFGLVAGLIVIVAGGGYEAQHHYLTRRYLTGTSPLDRLYAWAQHLPRTAIGVYGTVEDYPLSGPNSATRVDYIGTPVHDGGYEPATTCAAWRHDVNSAAVRYLVLGPSPTGSIPTVWTTTDPAARLIDTPGGGITVYRLSGRLNPAQCRAT